MYHILSFARCSSCSLRTKNKASVVPFPGMKPNYASLKSTNARILLSNTLSIMFMPCSSYFPPLYEPQFITSPLPLKIGTTTLVFHLFGILFPSETRWQSCSITSSAILPPATITSVVVSESPASFPCFIFLIGPLTSEQKTFSTGRSIIFSLHGRSS